MVEFTFVALRAEPPPVLGQSRTNRMTIPKITSAILAHAELRPIAKEH